MLTISIVAGVLVILALMGYRLYKAHIIRMESIVREIISTREETLETIASGLYHRFKRRLEGDNAKDTPYQKAADVENPIAFEHWVARIMEKYHGGLAIVTQASGDFGVDIEHKRREQLFLGQVKCECSPIDYKPIAIIHSQMIKQKATGGFVVTTSTFSENAKKYWRELGVNIQLIEGTDLAKIWLQVQQEQFEAVLEEQPK